MNDFVDKSQLVTAIVEKLQAELSTALAASQQAHESATHSENIAEHKYDTLGLEAAYLAHGQSMRITELQQALACYQHFQPPRYSADDAIKLGALVCLEDEQGEQKRVFIGPAAGGYTLGEGGDAVTVVTGSAPLGAQLLNRYLEDEVRLNLDSYVSQFTIISIA
jgi:transcription elongation GreA/GreB family factor